MADGVGHGRDGGCGGAQFIGVGETLEKLEPFYPDRMASRILGMGDVVTLVEKAQEEINTDDAMAIYKKMMLGAEGRGQREGA